ncbi:MAG TPA: hypothetical protein PLB10_00670 [Thiolinea sp.]|nr:hypothetical protein [Thiolinea sp.]
MAQSADAGRFQDVLKSAPGGVDASTDIGRSEPVLQFVDGEKAASSGGLAEALIERASKIDASYHGLVDQMANRPSLENYLSSPSGTGVQPDRIRTYPNVPATGGGDSLASSYDGIVDRMNASNNAALAYQNDLNQWSMSFRMWSTGVEVISAAASKISQGFQTLFRASG